MSEKRFVHPYIPNSEPAVKREMLDSIGMDSVEDIYKGIPDRLRYNKRMDLPEPIISEYSCERYMDKILDENRNAKNNICFLGGGTWNHYVPAVVETVMERDEFLTCYVGDAYTDHGKFQALWESSSMLSDLTGLEATCTPCYDWANAISVALRMASRMTGRTEVLVSGSIAKDRLLVVKNYCKPEIKVTLIDYDKKSGLLNIEDLKTKLNNNVASVYFENPSYLGALEINAGEICNLAHETGATAMVGVDPTSLGILEAPGCYGADYAVGELQPLGIHMNFGGGVGGFIATRDEERFVAEFPSLLFGVCKTSQEGEYGFGEVAYERTSYAQREKGKDFIGTTAALHGVAAAVYMALMGPQGFKEMGEGILQRVKYVKENLARIPGVKIPVKGYSYCDFLVDFNGTGKSVREINQELRQYNILGGKDISSEFPEYGQAALYSVTEVHTKEDLDTLIKALEKICA